MRPKLIRIQSDEEEADVVVKPLKLQAPAAIKSKGKAKKVVPQLVLDEAVDEDEEISWPPVRSFYVSLVKPLT